jgi:membrane protease subunit HflK
VDRRPGGPAEGGEQQIPEIDEIVRKGQEQLRVLMGGRGGRSGGGGDGGGEGFEFTRGTFALRRLLVIVALGSSPAFYTVVRKSSRSSCSSASSRRSAIRPQLRAVAAGDGRGLNPVTSERTESIGTAGPARPMTA